MTILNPRAQIPLVLAQIEREYSKGMEFLYRVGTYFSFKTSKSSILSSL